LKTKLVKQKNVFCSGAQKILKKMKCHVTDGKLFSLPSNKAARGYKTGAYKSDEYAARMAVN
jgi:hypothetical protein